MVRNYDYGYSVTYEAYLDAINNIWFCDLCGKHCFTRHMYSAVYVNHIEDVSFVRYKEES